MGWEMTQPPASCERHRVAREIVDHADRLWFRFPLSLRLVEEMPLARGIETEIIPCASPKITEGELT